MWKKWKDKDKDKYKNPSVKNIEEHMWKSRNKKTAQQLCQNGLFSKNANIRVNVSYGFPFLPNEPYIRKKKLTQCHME